jgi:hypothetical protein
LQHADDDAIFDRAAVEGRILVSRMLISERRSRCVRRDSRPSANFAGRAAGSHALARTLLANLPQLVDALENGSIVNV